ncbi:hypothetical protein F0562_005579 [Nyssa sinensis]|uniref:Uncharacterized protein n=1 Tax=Nyssa sinensis TaxID=561372 RepID=A0A5J5AMY7_9ASTE|nr:hypothetical protein F0562_005579 [Nyssa sinensis]
MMVMEGRIGGGYGDDGCCVGGSDGAVGDGDAGATVWWWRGGAVVDESGVGVGFGWLVDVVVERWCCRDGSRGLGAVGVGCAVVILMKVDADGG